MLTVYDTDSEHGEIVYGFLILLGFNVLFAIIASTLVAFEVRGVFLKLYPP
jgi:tetrahydromethanopterin S-methyltransferase subunit B